MTHAFGLEKNTRARIVACLLLSALIGIPRFFTVSAANLVFLEHHPATNLPYAYAASAFVIAAVGFLYTTMERRVGFLRTSIWGAFALAFAFAFTRVGYEMQGGQAAASFAMVLLAEVEFSLCTLAFWGIANRLFNVREAGKIFGVIGAGEIVPSVLGGLFLEEIVGGLGLSNLFWGTVFGHVSIAGALVLLGRLAATLTKRDTLGSVEEVTARTDAEENTSKMRDPLFLLVSSLLFFGVVSTYWVDNAFLFSLQDQFPNQEERARFLGRFFVALGLANLVFKFVLAHRWRGWLGGRKTLQSTPLSVLVVALLIFVFGLTLDAPKTLVWLVILLKLSERVLLESVNNPAFYSLFQAFSIEVRAQLQGKMETVVAQGATLFAGLFVLGVGTMADVGLSELLLLIAAVSVCWVVAAHFSWRAYVERILYAMQERRLHPGFVDIESQAARSVLQRGLTSNEPAKIVFSLRKLNEVNNHDIRHQMVAICEHKDGAVMDAACRTLERRGWTAEAETLAQKWSALGAPEKTARSRWLRTLAQLLPDKSVSLLLGELEDESLARRTNASIAILQSGDARLRMKAFACLANGLRETVAADRELVLRALPDLKGFIGAHEEEALVSLLLVSLCAQGDEAVQQRAAVQAAVAFSDADLWREVLSRLSHSELHASISRSALLSGIPAERALVAFLRRLHATDFSPLRRSAAALLAQLSEARNIDDILQQLSLLPAYERKRVLAVLPPRDFAPNESQRKILQQLIVDERRELDAIGSAWWSVQNVGAPNAVIQALWEDWEESLSSALQLVGLLTGKRESQYIGHWWGTPVEDRALALEYLETSLRDAEQTWLIPLLERTEPSRPDDFDGRRERIDEKEPGLSASLLAKRYSGTLSWLFDAIQSETLSDSVVGEVCTHQDKDEIFHRMDLLSCVEAFRDLKTIELSLLAQRGVWIDVHTGETWKSPSVDENWVAVVVRGRVKLQNGRQSWVRGDKEYFGNGWMASRKTMEPSVYAVEALEPSRLLCILDASFEELSVEEPAVSWRVLEGLAAAIQGAAQSIVHDVEKIPDDRRGVAVQKLGASEASTVLERTLALRGIALFQNLDDATLLAVARAAQERYLEPGEYLCAQGDEDAKLLIVLDGNALVHRGSTTLANLEGPCILGELGAITGAPRVATVQAETFCRVLHLERSAFYELVIRHRPMTIALRDLLLSMQKPDLETQFFAE